MTKKLLIGAVIGVIALIAVMVVIFRPKVTDTQKSKTQSHKLTPQEIERIEAEREVIARASQQKEDKKK